MMILPWSLSALLNKLLFYTDRTAILMQLSYNLVPTSYGLKSFWVTVWMLITLY